MSEDPLSAWPNCPTPDCPNKVCLWADTGMCYPCSEYALGKSEMEVRYTETHEEAICDCPECPCLNSVPAHGELCGACLDGVHTEIPL